MIDIFVILSNYTVGVWLTNAHTPPFSERLKTRGYNAHMPPTKVLHHAKSPKANERAGHVDTAHITPHQSTTL